MRAMPRMREVAVDEAMTSFGGVAGFAKFCRERSIHDDIAKAVTGLKVGRIGHPNHEFRKHPVRIGHPNHELRKRTSKARPRTRFERCRLRRQHPLPRAVSRSAGVGWLRLSASRPAPRAPAHTAGRSARAKSRSRTW